MGFPTKSPYVKVCTAPLKNAQFYCTIVIARRRVNGVSFPLRGHSLKLTSFLLSPYFFYTFPTTHVFLPRSKSLETHQPLFNQLLTTKKKQMDGQNRTACSWLAFNLVFFYVIKTAMKLGQCHEGWDKPPFLLSHTINKWTCGHNSIVLFWRMWSSKNKKKYGTHVNLRTAAEEKAKIYVNAAIRRCKNK